MVIACKISVDLTIIKFDAIRNLLTLVLRLGVKKAPNSVFGSVKNFCLALGAVLS